MCPTSDAADLPIARVLRLDIVCEDCGRRCSLDRHAVAREQIRRGLATPEALGSCLRCMLCAARGGQGRNVSITVRYAEGPSDARGGGHAPGNAPLPALRRKVEWSRAAVFGEDRSTPFPGLPRSRLLRE